MDNTLITAAVQIRHDMSDESLTRYVKEHFQDISILSLKQLVPLVDEVRRRFRRLPRKPGIDGKRKTISGCTRFADWCRVVLGRSDRSVRYMLSGGNTKRSKKTETGFRLTKDEKEKLQSIADELSLGVNDVIHSAIGLYLSSYE